MQVSDYAKELLLQDVVDMIDAIFNVSNTDRAIFMLAAMPYICLVIKEGYDWCMRYGVDLSKFASKGILENIRAKGKLFGNDKNIDFNSQFNKIKRLIKIEHSYFKSLAKTFAPDCLINDVGTFKIEDIFIGNTIQYSYDFSLFSKENTSIYESENEMRSFSTEIGETAQEIITKIRGIPYTINNVKNNIKEHSCLDYNFKRHFKNENNLIIFSLYCRINFLLYYFKRKCRKNSMLYLRIIYITFYSLKNDLEKLNIDSANAFDSFYDIKFRNSMAHYSLYKKIDINEIQHNVIGFGIIEKYFNISYHNLVLNVENKLEEINKILYNNFCLDINKGYDPDSII